MRCLAVAVLAIPALACSAPEGDGAALGDPAAAAGTAPLRKAYTVKRRSAPRRSAVFDATGSWVATFTDGARTVRLRGPSRTFDEVTAAAPVVTGDWVRLLPEPFAGKVDVAWLDTALADRSPDVLAQAVDFIQGAPLDASYGPLVDGVRQEGSDFHDYLGLDWTFENGTRAADPAELGSLDCSGFVRMVYGYLGGVPLSFGLVTGSLPRRSFQILDAGPGTVVVASTGARVSDLGPLRAGDLVFFDASTSDGTRIDHVGIYLGADTAGHSRFLSSRRSADGPTLGDLNGPSILDGTYLFARSFRAVRRL